MISYPQPLERCWRDEQLHEMSTDCGSSISLACAQRAWREGVAAAAAALGERLLVWGLREDEDYALSVEASVPPGTLDWRGFLPTRALQAELGRCRALINTPKWNEAYGNVVVEALACGVPVVAYDRGGPGELICSGTTGFLVEPDDVAALTQALRDVTAIDRSACRAWVEQNADQAVFARRVETWISEGLTPLA